MALCRTLAVRVPGSSRRGSGEAVNGLKAGSRLAQQQVTLRNEVLKCFVRPPSIRVQFASQAAECGLDIGTREPWMQSERYGGYLQFYPKVLTDSPG